MNEVVWIIIGYFTIGFVLALAASISENRGSDDGLLIVPLLFAWPLTVLIIGSVRLIDKLGELIVDWIEEHQ